MNPYLSGLKSTGRPYLTLPGTCEEGQTYLAKFPNLPAAWEACEEPEYLFWYMERYQPLYGPDSALLALALLAPWNSVPELDQARNWILGAPPMASSEPLVTDALWLIWQVKSGEPPYRTAKLLRQLSRAIRVRLPDDGPRQCQVIRGIIAFQPRTSSAPRKRARRLRAR